MWTKQIPSNTAGTRNGMIVLPKHIKASNQVRSHGTTSSTLPPTVLEAASLPEPTSVNGTVQAPIEGVSMLSHFRKPPKFRAITRPQYFEIMGNRAIYQDGWCAGTIHRAPWEAVAPSQAARGHLGTLRRAQRLQPEITIWLPRIPKSSRTAGPLHEGGATKYRVLPSDDRVLERNQRRNRRRPRPDGNRTSLHAFRGWGMSENVFINVKTARSRSRRMWRFPRAERTA